MRTLRFALPLCTLAILATARPVEAQYAPSMVLQAEVVTDHPDTVVSNKAIMNIVPGTKLTVRTLTLSEVKPFKLSLSASRVTSCQMQSPSSGQWVGLPVNNGVVDYKSVPIETTHPWYPASGKNTIIKYQCVGGNGIVIADSVKIARAK